MIALLLRHGQTPYTSEQRFLGLTDLPLDHAGRRQATDVAGTIARFAPNEVIHSPLTRVRETVQLMAPPDLRLRADERLAEVDFGAWEGLTQDEVAAVDPDGKRHFDNGDLDRFPGGETPADAAQRIVAAITDEHARAGRLLVVGHNTAFRLALTGLLGLDATAYRQTFATLRPCHWAEVRIAPDGSGTLIAYNSQEVLST